MRAAFALPFAPAQQHRAPPLDLARVVGAPAWSRLTPEVRRRFAPGHQPATYHGALTIRHSWAGALFARVGALLGRPLPLHAGTDVPAEVQVRPDGQGGVVWERWLREPGRAAACVRSTKHTDRDGGVSERTDRLLGMALDVRVEGEALVFESRFYFLATARRGRRLRIPVLLTPGRCRVTHAPAGPGRFRFTLTMTHPLLGETSSQDGIFTDPAEDQP